MNARDNRPQKSNPLKGLFILLGLGVLAVFVWNLIGAYQCYSIEGEIQLKGISVACYKDFSSS